MTAPPRKTVWWVRALVSLAFAAAIVLRTGPSRIVQTVRDVDPLLLGYALALGVPRLVVKVARWKVLAERAVPPVSWGLATRSLFVGTAGAVVTPGRVGQAAAALVFPEGSRMVVSGVALMDPLADLLVVALLAVFVAGGPLWSALVVGGYGTGWWVALRLGGALRRRDGALGALGVAVGRMDWRALCLVGALSLLIYGFNLVQFHLLLSAHGPVPFAAAARSLPLIFLAVACPITVSGFGLREAASVLTLARYGVDPGVAIGASFELFLINFLAPGLVGAGVAGRLGIRLRRGPPPPAPGDNDEGRTPPTATRSCATHEG